MNSIINQDYLFLYQIVCINFETHCIFGKNSVRANHWLIRKPLQKPHSFLQILAPTPPAPNFFLFFFLTISNLNIDIYICAFGFFLVFLFFILTGHWVANWEQTGNPLVDQKKQPDRMTSSSVSSGLVFNSLSFFNRLSYFGLVHVTFSCRITFLGGMGTGESAVVCVDTFCSKTWVSPPTCFQS